MYNGVLKKNCFSYLFSFLFLVCFIRVRFFAASHLVGFVLTFIFSLVLYLKNIKLRINKKDFLYLNITILFGIIFFSVSGNPSGNPLFSYLLFFSEPVFLICIANLVLMNISLDMLFFKLEKLIRLSIIYLFIEVFVRYSHIATERNPILIYILLKTETFTFSDCNFLGLLILMLFCLVFYLYSLRKSKKYKRFLIELTVLGFLSFSRSVMLTMISIYFIDFVFKIYKKGYFLLLYSIVIGMPLLIIILYNLLMNDASFRSKIGIFQGFARIKGYNLSQVLLGFGYGVGEYAYSYRLNGFGHVHLALLMGEIGIIGTFLFVFWLVRMNFISKHKTFIIFFAFWLSGFSLAFLDSSLYLVIAIITDIEIKNRRQINEKACGYINTYIQ